MEIYISEEALEDLENIHDFYKNKSLQAADNIYNSILEDMMLLEEQPYAAPIESLTKKFKDYEARSLTVAGGLFKVLFFVDETTQTVAVAQIFACRQSPEKIR